MNGRTPPIATALTVILTHEHTDFDALASLLAATKLHPQAVPVLPRRMNRNLESFLAVYRDALPFVAMEDLPRRRIDHVILVDTQTVQPVRGMHPGTTGACIDHHPVTRPLPQGWTFWGEEVGATTTLFVEQFAADGIPVTPIEATLLALGVYEDTGSLSYPMTTPRDLRSVAWLLDHGANLLVVNRFLHHPLTDEQMALYQALADNSQPHLVHGHSVIIASATVSEPVDEISTLAHKLQDLYEPDGLFMLVDMGDRIQVVARSTTDAIDVGKLAMVLGGGGHSRAAAAMIRGGALPGVFETLVYLLQSHVRPTVTVGQIMSYGAPQTLSPDETIASAAERMRRYGFEGFPVVDGGRIVGMLTRREIDRALQHGLEKHPVSRYMRAGEVSVRPDDSVETLRRVMTEQDWGQVPVVNPASGEIIGIVTRTDLIKQWPGETPAASEAVAGLLVQALPVQLVTLLRQAGEVAGELGYPLYVVGGFVRDLLLGQPNYDVDLVVEGEAIRVAHQLAQRHGGRVRSHRRFGTAKWILPQDGTTGGNGLPKSLDFVTARTEFYEHPTALPTVERSSIKQDLHRRDFTINTLAVRLTPDRWGELLDFYGGRKDLDEGIIRVLHSLSFIEDPTRILRAVRFEQRFRFSLEDRTEELIAGGLDLLDRTSAERIRHELELLLVEAEPERALCRLAELNVLAHLHPDLRCDAWLSEKSVELRAQLARARDPSSTTPPPMDLAPDAAPRLHLALLTHRLSASAEEEFRERFRLRKEYRDLMVEVRALASRLGPLAESAVRNSEIVAILDESSDEARLLLRVVADHWLVRQRLDLYQRKLKSVRPVTGGEALRGLGIEPGRIYREILERLRAARLDGEISTGEDELLLIRRMVEGAQGQKTRRGI